MLENSLFSSVFRARNIYSIHIIYVWINIIYVFISYFFMNLQLIYTEWSSKGILMVNRTWLRQLISKSKMYFSCCYWIEGLRLPQAKIVRLTMSLMRLNDEPVARLPVFRLPLCCWCVLLLNSTQHLLAKQKYKKQKCFKHKT